MRYEIEKELFTKELNKALHVTSPKSTLPQLGNVKLELDGNVLAVEATDLQVAIRTSYTVAGKGNGAITVCAKKLYEIVKELPAGDVFFTSKENTGWRSFAARPGSTSWGSPPMVSRLFRQPTS